MSRLPITIASWDYDRVRALTDGRVHVEGCDVNYITMPVEECFERAYFHGEFEVAEIGFSPFLIALSRGPTPYVALPVFLSRMFRHSAVYIRSDRGIEGPADLRGKRIGVPEYQMSAVMWFRGYLQDEFGIKAAGHQLGTGGAGKSRPARQVSAQSAAGFPLTSRNDVSLSAMLAEGRTRWRDVGARAVLLCQPASKSPAAVSRLPRRRARLFSQDRHISDHARARHPPRHL